MNRTIIDGIRLKEALQGSAKYLSSNKEEINALNVFPVPDGDTGTNMSLTIQSAVKKVLATDSNKVSDIAYAASQGSLMGARGNSGVILSQLFRGFSDGLSDREELDIIALADAFKSASDTAYKAVMKPTEGTILTVARECGEYAQKIAKDEDDIIIFLKKVIDRGNESLNNTPNLLPVLKQAGVVDAGGKGLMAVLIGAYRSLTGEEIIEEVSLEDQEQAYKEVVQHKHLDTDDIKYGYCTEFMINGDASKFDVETFRNFLASKGDSLMVVQGDSLIKVHVHTNNPGLALEKALELGSLMDIKIDNMRLQHEKVMEEEAKKKPKNTISKKYSFITVSPGLGITDVFKSLSVDKIVQGGQTMNPSTEDFAKAIDESEGENVFILPNNSNIILAAEQAKDLSERNVFIIPSKTIPQGISALFAFDESEDIDNNMENMLEAIGEVQTGQVTYAVRDTEIDGKVIKKDDIIGIADGKILVNGEETQDVLLELLDSMIDEDSSLLTLLYGEEIEEESLDGLETILNEKYEDVDIEIINGGQPIYYYIVSVE